MKTELRLRVQAVWQTLTEVPGWPDAPRSLRIRRVLPIAIPAVVFLFLGLWHLAWVSPSIARERTRQEPVRQLAAELHRLRDVSTEAGAAMAAARASEAARMLLQSAAELPAELEALQETAKAQGWQASFQPLPVSSEPAPEGAVLTFLPVRARLVPLATNARPFDTLVSVLEQLSSPSRRIDLTRLLIRADDQGRQSVEFHLQLGCHRLP